MSAASATWHIDSQQTAHRSVSDRVGEAEPALRETERRAAHVRAPAPGETASAVVSRFADATRTCERLDPLQEPWAAAADGRGRRHCQQGPPTGGKGLKGL